MKQSMCVALLSFATMLAGCDGATEKAQGEVPRDMEGQTLALDAPGCVATGPDGKPLQLPENVTSGPVVIPLGSTLTLECFPDVGKKQ